MELDGPVHDATKRQPVDAKRDAYLKSLGMTIVRIKNERLFEETETVLHEIAQAIAPGGASQPPSPFGRGAGVRVNGFRDRRKEILFIDARKLGRMVDRTHRELTDEDVTRIANTYHAWRNNSPSPLEGEGRGEGEKEGEGENSYTDVPGFCKSAPLEEVRKHGHVLTPGRYVGAEAQEEDDEPFEDKMKRLTAQLREQQTEGAKLDKAITDNLKALGFPIGGKDA